MTPDEFERVLTRACEILTENLRSSDIYHNQDVFQQHSLDTLKVAAKGLHLRVEPSFHPHAFPDIRANGFGVEVKYTKQDAWLAVGNSIFEGMRDQSVDTIYVLYGKVGGVPEARWGRYEDCITHVRVSHAPRFVVDMGDSSSRLFDLLPVTYDEFADLSREEKMAHIREYSRGWLAQGEHLWWLEEGHTLPLEVRLYVHLPQEKKRMIRAEAALLCPQVCGGDRVRGKYLDAALYVLTYHGVLCHQARDLFTAGSVAGARGDGVNPEGPYIAHALADMEHLMRDAVQRLPDSLFVEYWGESCLPMARIPRWLELADGYAATSDWLPSARLFRG